MSKLNSTAFQGKYYQDKLLNTPEGPETGFTKMITSKNYTHFGILYYFVLPKKTVNIGAW